MMKLTGGVALLISCAFACCAHAEESKYNEIMKLLSNSDVQLKPEAQTYSASVADPNESYSPSGHSRSSERSRYSPSSKNTADDDDDVKKSSAEEEETKPDRLALLLADSKFSCDGLKNGYYADESVKCAVFHYCIDNVRHSWQCPENTVFHQIHLNCVPDTQDICRESSKFHVVNDYLHKELDERGPNNTVLYHQRFYPEGFDTSGGDTVTQIFQAQAQAALQKARNRNNNRHAPSEESDYEEDSPPAPRPPPRSRPKPSYSSAQPPRSQPRSSYKPISRPVSIPLNYPPPQPAPTKRPESFNAPTYTESSSDDYSSDFPPPSPSSSSSSAVSPSSGSSSGFSSGPSGFSSGGESRFSPSNSFSGSSSGGHSSHSSQPSSSFRSSGSSRPSSYPVRTLGVPIASFRVAPSQNFASSASNVHQINVAMAADAAFNHQVPQVRNYFI